jgi:hypothetical protein
VGHRGGPSVRHVILLVTSSPHHPLVASSCPWVIVGRIKDLPGAQTTSDVVWALWFVVTTIVIPKINYVVNRKWIFFKKAYLYSPNNVRRHLGPFVLADSAINVVAVAVVAVGGRQQYGIGGSGKRRCGECM